MRYELMFPWQIRQAIDGNWPIILPLGVLEYHSEHCCVGVDTLLVTRAVEELEKEMDLVILPPFYYGAGTYAVEPPERNGGFHTPSEVLTPLAREIFLSALRVGFKNLHVFIHHQSENFAVGMPTDLAFKLAARQAIFAFVEKNRPEGWWGDNAMKDYYADNDNNPFNWIQIHPLMDEAAQKAFPIDHAGWQETSLMLAFCPEGVDMSRHSGEKWYAERAVRANAADGAQAKRLTLDGMRRALGF